MKPVALSASVSVAILTFVVFFIMHCGCIYADDGTVSKAEKHENYDKLEKKLLAGKLDSAEVKPIVDRLVQAKKWKTLLKACESNSDSVIDLVRIVEGIGMIRNTKSLPRLKALGRRWHSEWSYDGAFWSVYNAAIDRLEGRKTPSETFLEESKKKPE